MAARACAYLVRRDRVADADEAVAALRSTTAGTAEVEYVGPLPVYSFLAERQSQATVSTWGW